VQVVIDTRGLQLQDVGPLPQSGCGMYKKKKGYIGVRCKLAEELGVALVVGCAAERGRGNCVVCSGSEEEKLHGVFKRLRRNAHQRVQRSRNGHDKRRGVTWCAQATTLQRTPEYKRWLRTPACAAARLRRRGVTRCVQVGTPQRTPACAAARKKRRGYMLCTGNYVATDNRRSRLQRTQRGPSLM
jgi:hypothetical protein